MTPRIHRAKLRTVFGRDPARYDRARTAYPPEVFEILTDRCGLAPGKAVFEIGPGTGIATRELLARGADPLVLIEADRRLVRYLRRTLDLHGADVQFRTGPFERAVLPRAYFDLGVAATSFHWLPARLAFRRVARALRPGGWWAVWNNRHSDPYREGPFSRALISLYAELEGRRTSNATLRAADRRQGAKRLAAARAVGAFERISRQDIHWKVTLSAERVAALWGTFSDVLTLPAARRRWFLAELRRIGNEDLGGRVTVPMLTSVYTARRR